jgi:hypothetical protein
MKKILFVCLLLTAQIHYGQTEIDGIMMEKNNLCSGIVYQTSSWDHYWEGTNYRNNPNFGVVSTQKIAVNANYGITDRFNVIVSLPYVMTEASAGTLKGQKGFQDISLTLKYVFYETKLKVGLLSFYGIGSYTTPLSNYPADYLPLSLGLRSKTTSLRLMADYQIKKWFVTNSLSYSHRANIKIDREVYYTNQMNYSNIVDMPNQINYNFRMGYRSHQLISELIYDSTVTQKGGFDMTLNNMPFPSNTMNGSMIGTHNKYTFKSYPALSLVGGYSHVINGRNIGQSNTIYGGLFYVLDTTKKEESTQNSSENEK